jgi:hypothetical protein
MAALSFQPGSSDSESVTDCFESCDPRSPDPEEDPEPSEAESERLRPPEAGPEGSESSESESSETESEDSDSSEAESEGFRPLRYGGKEKGSTHFQLERLRFLLRLVRLRGVRLEQHRLGLCVAILIGNRDGFYSFGTVFGGD